MSRPAGFEIPSWRADWLAFPEVYEPRLLRVFELGRWPRIVTSSVLSGRAPNRRDVPTNAHALLSRALRRIGWCDDRCGLARRLDDRAAQERALNPRERLQQFYGLPGAGEAFARFAERRLLLEHFSKIDHVRM